MNIAELATTAQNRFGNIVKAVVDVDKKVIVIDADLHADEETELIHSGSRQENLWGINLYPELFGTEDFIEFDSMINVRPSQGNKTRSVDSVDLQKKIRTIVSNLVLA